MATLSTLPAAPEVAGPLLTAEEFVRRCAGQSVELVKGHVRVNSTPTPKEGILPVTPDLLVEVRSPSDGWGEVFTKVGEYLQAGVRAVVVLDAASGTASVYRSEELQQIFHNGDELVISEILPGFAVPVRRLLVS